MMSCEYLRVIYYFLKYLFHVFMFLSIAFFKSIVSMREMTHVNLWNRNLAQVSND